MKVTIRYYAGARAAAGLEEEAVDAAEGITVAELSALLAARHGSGLARVLGVSSFLVDEVATGPERLVPAGATLDVLPSRGQPRTTLLA